MHGLDGLDEITLTAKTRVAEAHQGSVWTFEIAPDDFGVDYASLESVRSDDAETSARMIRDVLDGARRDEAHTIIALNAAAAPYVGGMAGDLREAMSMAETSIESGARQARRIGKGNERMNASPDFLREIIKSKRSRLDAAKSALPLEELRPLALNARGGAQPHVLRDALRREGRVNIIAEIKRASPSKGVIREDTDTAEIAAEYEAGGAAAISVLTEEDRFLGSLDDLRAARAAVSLPLLRKDFIFDEYQIYEAAAAGADALLLIVAALEDEKLKSLRRITEKELRMDALVEAHTGEELRRALDCGATLIGVNNRNLRTFEVSLDVSVGLVRQVSAGTLLISESGLRLPDDIRRLRELGYRGFLIGESLMRAANPAQALQALIAEAER